jgi:hypothetical protein
MIQIANPIHRTLRRFLGHIGEEYITLAGLAVNAAFHLP